MHRALWSLVVVTSIAGCNSCAADRPNRAPPEVRMPVVHAEEDSAAAPRSASLQPKPVDQPAWIDTGQFPSVAPVSIQDGIAALRHTKQRAVVELALALEECSGMGGAHLFFRLNPDRQAEYAHFGGHGVSFSRPAVGTRNANAAVSAQAPEPEFVSGQLYVIGFERVDESLHDPGWCLSEAPKSSARVLVLVPVRDRKDGEALLRELEK